MHSKLLQKIYPKEIKKVLLFFTIGLAALFCLYSYGYKGTISEKQIVKDIMEYPMVTILQRCKNDYSYTDEDMIVIEKELKRYFVLSALNKPGLGMYSKDVDNLWHTFILFTKEYANFCKNHTNGFIHHIPEIDKTLTPEKLEENRKDFQAFIKSYEETFQEEMHPIWFLDMCENPS